MASARAARQRSALQAAPALAGKVPPSPSEPAERATLGAILQDANCFFRIREILDPSDFFSDANRVIFAAFAALAADSGDVDLLTTTDRLQRDGTLDAAGGVTYLAGLADELPDPANVEHYARIVRERSVKRQTGASLQRVALACREQTGDMAALLADAEASLLTARDRLGIAPGAQSERAFGDAVAREQFTLRVRSEAQRRLAAEAADRRPFDAVLLKDVPQERLLWRAKGLLPRRGRLLVSAQRKCGKTVLVLNAARHALRGGYFLGRFEVEPIAGQVALLNLEVSGAQIAAWAREARVPGDRLLLVNLRGRSNPFSDDEETARLATVLRDHAVELLIVDPFGRAYTGQSQNDAGEVGAWLCRLDRFAEAAGCSEVILTAHAGWDGERTRGTTALEDWADAVAYLVRDKANETVRFFRAFGRDVEVEEDRLLFEPETRTLTLAGSGSRASVRQQERLAELVAGAVDAVTREPGATTGRLGALMREAGLGLQHGDAGRAARAAVEAELIVGKPGARRAVHYYLAGGEPQKSRVVPSSPGGTTGLVPTPPYRGGTSPGLLEGPVAPDVDEVSL